MSQTAAKLWFPMEANRLAPINVGNINQTFVLENDKGKFVLQRLNPIFAPEVNLDIEALTSHLKKKGFATTTLIPTALGALFGEIDGHCWRLLTFVEGESLNSLSGVKRAMEAGRLVGSFHQATADFQHVYRSTRGYPHDTKEHLRKLALAVENHPRHAMIEEVRPLADRIFEVSRGLSDFSNLPKKNAHGDLKISNIIFGKTHAQHTLIDLDTIGLMPWPIEMGDAFRSWCNPHGESAESVYFDENLFASALGSYAAIASEFWSKEEIALLFEGIRTIPLELSSRFLRDVLEDSYFGFDASRFESRSAHNFLRAKVQFALYCDIEKKKAQLEHIIKTSFA